MGLFEDDDQEEEEQEDIEENFQCMYDDCEEWFETHDDRLYHSLGVHWDIDPRKYPTLTGADEKILFDV